MLKPGMNAEVSIHTAEREDVTAVPTAALRAMSDIPATAAMLGIPESQLRDALDGGSGSVGAGGAQTVSIGGRTVELPPDVDRRQIEAVLAKSASGDLSDDERQLMRRVMAQAFGGPRPSGGAGNVSPPAGGFVPPSGGFARGVPPGGFGGFAPASGNGNRRSAPPAGYQFGGDYWVVALRNNEPAPTRVRTGLTDLEYSEVLAGLAAEDRVLLLPSASLFEQQERLQQFISERFSSGPFQQQQGPSGGRRP
jgi:hypothetical protein